MWVTITSTAPWPRPPRARPAPTAWARSCTNTCSPDTSGSAPATAGPAQSWSEQETGIRGLLWRGNKKTKKLGEIDILKLIHKQIKTDQMCSFLWNLRFHKVRFYWYQCTLRANMVSKTWILFITLRFCCDWHIMITAMREWLCQYFLWLYFLWHVIHKYLYNPQCLY